MLQEKHVILINVVAAGRVVVVLLSSPLSA